MCESWMNGDLKPLEKLYNWSIKQLLGVRMSTCTDVCYAELGLPPLKFLVMAKQRKFLQRMWGERQLMVDDPWVHAVKLVLETNITTSRYIDGLIDNNIDDAKAGKDYVKLALSNSTSSR